MNARIPSSVSTCSTLSSDDLNEKKILLPTIRDEVRYFCSVPIGKISLPALMLENFENIKFYGKGKEIAYFSASLWGSAVVIKAFSEESSLNVERHLLERVCHDNIVKIFAVGSYSSRFIVVERVQGESLDDFIYRRTVYVPSLFNRLIYGVEKKRYLLHSSIVLSIAKQIFTALKYLHEEVHTKFTIIHGGKQENLSETVFTTILTLILMSLRPSTEKHYV